MNENPCSEFHGSPAVVGVLANNSDGVKFQI